jgi:hypothetical protein
MKGWCCLIFMISIFVASQGNGQEIYRWADEKGILHFVDDLTQVPEKYRDQFQKKEPPKEPIPSPSASSQGGEGKIESDPSSVRKDLHGRGEDWWRAKAKEANDRLQNAQKNYDSAYQAWKAKEQQREEGTSKSHGPRKRLGSEIDKLEEKVKESQKELEEAKEVVEMVLPRQAEDYKADPSWLKPKE